MGVYTGEYPVKAQDSADNVFTLDVIGNKTDTTSGTSIVSLVKVVDSVVDTISAGVGSKGAGDDLHGKVDTVDTVVDAISDTVGSRGAGANIHTLAEAINSRTEDMDSALAVLDLRSEATAVSGSFTYINATGGEQIVWENTGTTKRIFGGMVVSAANMTQNGVLKLHQKVDGTNYIVLLQNNFTATSPNKGILFNTRWYSNVDVKVTYEATTPEGADRAIPFRYMTMSVN